MKIPLFLTALALLPLPAAELTITSAPLETTLEVEATLLPEEPVPFQLKPEQWSTFTIRDLIDHGASVKAGEAVISFEDEDYQRALEEGKAEAKARAIELAKTERELADLETTTPRTLEGLKLAHDRAKEALDYFLEIGRPLEIEDAEKSLERAERSLRYQQEELDQLLKMYEEDGLTEETEEIILTRQKAQVDSAKFALKKAKLATEWNLEKSIPRKTVDLQRDYNQALLAYETGKLNLPRELEQKTLAVAKARRTNRKADEDLAALEADSKFFTLKAPADGMVFHGEIKDGTWSLGNTAKFLFKTGSAPVNTTLMTLMPAGSPLVLHGKVDQGQYLALSSETTGSATIAGLSGSSFPVKVTTLAPAPNAAGRYSLEMSIELPEDHPLVEGMKAQVILVTYRNDDAITIPDRALTTSDGKATVKLKMADGKFETREVTTGREVDGKTEILEGLEVDQVIVLPDPSPSQ